MINWRNKKIVEFPDGSYAYRRGWIWFEYRLPTFRDSWHTRNDREYSSCRVKDPSEFIPFLFETPTDVKIAKQIQAVSLLTAHA